MNHEIPLTPLLTMQSILVELIMARDAEATFTMAVEAPEPDKPVYRFGVLQEPGS